jgi:hypothetical protein
MISIVYDEDELALQAQRPYQHHRCCGSVQATNRKFAMSSEKLATLWGIVLEKAERALQAPTQRSVRSAIDPLHGRFRTQQQQFCYNRLNMIFYSDTMFSAYKSVR